MNMREAAVKQAPFEPANDSTAPEIADIDASITVELTDEAGGRTCLDPATSGLIGAILANGKGGELLDEGDYDGAIACFTAASHAPGWIGGNARVMLGVTYHELGRTAEARDAFTDGIAQGCSSPAEAYRRRAFCHAALGDFNAAIADMRQALEDGEDAAFAAAKLAVFHLSIGDPAAALTAALDSDATLASEIEHRMLQVMTRAEIHLLLGDRDRAAADLAREDAVSERDDPSFALWRHTLHRRLGRTQFTPAVAQVILQQDPANRHRQIAELLTNNDIAACDALLAPIQNIEAMGTRTTMLCEEHYRVAAFAEGAGALELARKHYLIAAADPECAWCIEYPLALYGLRRVEAALNSVTIV